MAENGNGGNGGALPPGLQKALLTVLAALGMAGAGTGIYNTAGNQQSIERAVQNEARIKALENKVDDLKGVDVRLALIEERLRQLLDVVRTERRPGNGKG